ncbi:MAG: D-alanyl-lipoteichoic acid biosynthesis protein DltD [Atopobiaceae bacterium]|nr:D-alanyl-lipoteichoic acid biosynthesis protein DltD [Atopobiaceae bacterium]
MAHHQRTTRQTIHRLIALLGGAAVAAAVALVLTVSLPAQSLGIQSYDYGYVYSGAKSSSVSFMTSAMDDSSLVVLGSSEFSTPSRIVSQMPVNVFGAHNYGVKLMCVGEAYDQCLWDSIALGALAGKGLPRNKVALIVGLGQLVDGGLDSQTFETRFSYSLWKACCDNPQLSDATKQYVRRRLLEQGIDETTVQAGLREGLLGSVNDLAFSWLDDMRLRNKLSSVRNSGIEAVSSAPEKPDFTSLYSAALDEAKQKSTNNDWGVEDSFWSSQLEPVLEQVKDSRTDERYSDTPEYDDLDCFLTMCEECGVEPLVIIQPTLGPYYDHIGISAETRGAAYQRLRDVVGKHAAAQLADFSSHEYEQYFLYDIVHFGWTGWVEAEKALYSFAEGD